MFFVERLCESFCHPWSASIEEMSIRTSSYPAKAIHQFGSTDPVSQWKAVDTAEPDQGHAIGHYQVGRIKNLTELSVLPGFSNAVHSRYGHVPRDSLRVIDPGTQLFHRIEHLDCVHPNA
jgi:hypothetical protein